MRSLGINLKIIPDLGKPLKQIVLFVIASPVMECICCSDARQAYQICRLDDYTMFHESLRKLLDTVKNSTGNPRKALSVLTYAILCEIEKDNRKPKRLDQFNQIFYSIRQAPQYYKRVFILTSSRQRQSRQPQQVCLRHSCHRLVRNRVGLHRRPVCAWPHCAPAVRH